MNMVSTGAKGVNRRVLVWSRFRVMVRGQLEVVLKREQRGWRADERAFLGCPWISESVEYARM